ncbi:biotin carboxylase C-terminal domain protein [Mycobacterium xenopi 3993]|nr:biotin carboxylase C-terminal domain protein [Mycobacterium xenopi 3993]
MGLPAGITAHGTDVTGEPAPARGIAIQTRVNMETIDADGSVVPTAGTLTGFTPPSGPGVRVDTYGRPGLTLSPRYDSLLAKVITHVHGTSFPAALRKARTALADFSIEGIGTNIPLLREILSASEVQSGLVTTGFLDAKLPELAAAALTRQPEIRVTALELYPGEEALCAPMAGTVVEVAPEGAEFAAADRWRCWKR